MKLYNNGKNIPLSEGKYFVYMAVAVYSKVAWLSPFQLQYDAIVGKALTLNRSDMHYNKLKATSLTSYPIEGDYSPYNWQLELHKQFSKHFMLKT